MAASDSASGSVRPRKCQATEEKGDDIDRELLSVDDQILLLEDFQKYLEKYGEEEFRWKIFYKTTKLNGEYTSKQLKRKIGELRESFERSQGAPPPSDPLQSRIYNLSNSIWGEEADESSKVDGSLNALTVPDSVDESGDDPNKTKRKRERKMETKRKTSVVDSIKPKDYLHLEMLVKTFKLVGNDDWTMVGNENATRLEQECLQITNMLNYISYDRKLVVDDLYSIIKERMSSLD